ncbi:MAG: hypothetical protein FJ213_02960 [Ignavibacteria bacterium]|nr:hypothetical protein [Ignavibacteria bacterium]
MDYNGTFSYGEYETDERRERRFHTLLEQIKMLDPDVIFTQETNPVGKFSSRLAEELKRHSKKLSKSGNLALKQKSLQTCISSKR